MTHPSKEHCHDIRKSISGEEETKLGISEPAQEKRNTIRSLFREIKKD